MRPPTRHGSDKRRELNDGPFRRHRDCGQLGEGLWSPAFFFQAVVLKRSTIRSVGPEHITGKRCEKRAHVGIGVGLSRLVADGNVVEPVKEVSW